MTSKKLALLLILMLSGVSSAQTPIVLELFTSEGCSSCPPAEELFAKLCDEPDVIALAFHVDYWNRLGWTDPFSRAEWSQRQGRWTAALGTEEVYTPMLVAGGLGHCVASDEPKVRALMAQAKKAGAKSVHLKVEKAAAGKLKASVDFDDSGNVKANLVLFEDGLSSDVKSGENEGKKLVHRHVVRAVVEGEEAEFALDPSWKTERLGVAAILLDDKARVLAAAQAKP